MDQRDLLGSARNQLDRVLGFFPRVDAKASVVLAVDTGMLAFLVAHVPSPSFVDVVGNCNPQATLCTASSCPGRKKRRTWPCPMRIEEMVTNARKEGS